MFAHAVPHQAAAPERAALGSIAMVARVPTLTRLLARAWSRGLPEGVGPASIRTVPRLAARLVRRSGAWGESHRAR
jgi:hypothetical protein